MTEAEWQTRKHRIDTKLTTLNPGWKVIPYKSDLDTSALTAHAVTEFPTANGPADYALFVKGKLLGILEAKKVAVGPQNVLEQAKRYSKGAFHGSGNWDSYRVPFLYSTNGEKIWFIDVRDDKSSSRPLSAFHTPDALSEMFETDRSEALKALLHNPTEIEKARDYQKSAIQAVESAIIKDKRSMLVAMATGTGKTFTTVALIYRLLRAKAVRRVLFLVDRRALAAQAVREFAAFNTPSGSKFNLEYEVFSQKFHKDDFDDDKRFDPKVLPSAYLTNPGPAHTFVYVSTIQRMTINLYGRENAPKQKPDDPDYDDDAERIDIPIHAFDLIIADECHRGYTAKETAIWRDVMNYFDAVKIGLTATPAAHSLSLFKEVVFRFTTDQAIQAGCLVDYDAVKIKSGVRMKGVFLKKGEQVGIVDTETGEETYDELEDERKFDTEDLEKRITAPDSNRKVVKEIARYAYEHQNETGRFPKILIFAVNDLQHTSHADQIVQICRDEFGQGDAFVQKITGSPNVDRPLQKIREFRNRPEPKVVVTVDMLATGVDIPSLEFVVFMRPVKSRTLWVQMLGRGTRLCPEINKGKFTIFDCFDGTLINYFRNTTDFHIEPPQKEALSIEQVIENIYQNIDRDYYTKVLIKRLRRIDRTMSGNAREKFAVFIDEGDMKRFADELFHKIAGDFDATMRLLRNPAFQDLLVNYERAKRDFYIGYEVEDEVSSEVMIPMGSGYQKPEDYLDSFARFVKENPEQIEAIQILLERPKDWNTNSLGDLRRKLAQNDFPEETVRKAYKLVYTKALTDIISMVKHAAREEEPILTSGERVDKALTWIAAGRAFTAEQQEWLSYIKQHLIENLTIDLSDFDYVPVFERHGGIAKANKVFEGTLEMLVKELNYVIAA